MLGAELMEYNNWGLIIISFRKFDFIKWSAMGIVCSLKVMWANNSRSKCRFSGFIYWTEYLRAVTGNQALFESANKLLALPYYISLVANFRHQTCRWEVLGGGWDGWGRVGDYANWILAKLFCFNIQLLSIMSGEWQERANVCLLSQTKPKPWWALPSGSPPPAPSKRPPCDAGATSRSLIVTTSHV